MPLAASHAAIAATRAGGAADADHTDSLAGRLFGKVRRAVIEFLSDAQRPPHGAVIDARSSGGERLVQQISRCYTKYRMTKHPHAPLSAALRAIASQLGFRVGFPTDADRGALPHVVRYPTLSREQLGDWRFERVYRMAVGAAAHYAGRLGYLAEPIRDHRSVVVGREFRFSDSLTAIRFKLIVDAALANRHLPLAEVAR